MSQLLTEADLAFLVGSVADRRTDHETIVEIIRDKDDFLEPMLDDPRLVERLFNDEQALVSISPFLLFSILLRHVRREIENESYLYDYEVGARKQRIPVFAVDEVKDLLSARDAIDYLAEMLASFARTRNLVFTWKNEETGRREKKRFNDMDIDDMIRLCRELAPPDRTRYYRRIGDIALFLSGVFPEHAAFYHFLTPRSSRSVSRGRNLHDYEREGQEFYLRAAEQTREPERGTVLAKLSENFSNARRALNVLSERYLQEGNGRPYFGAS